MLLLKLGLAFRAAATSGCTGGRSSTDVEELDVEDQRRAGGDLRRPPLIAVRDRRGADQPRLAACLHPLGAFGPAGEHLVEPELRRAAVRRRAVEDGAVDEVALIFDANGAGARGSCPGAFAKGAVNQARRRTDRAWLARLGLEDGPASLLLGGDLRVAALGQEGVDARAPLFEVGIVEGAACVQRQRPRTRASRHRARATKAKRGFMCAPSSAPMA